MLSRCLSPSSPPPTNRLLWTRSPSTGNNFGHSRSQNSRAAAVPPQPQDIAGSPSTRAFLYRASKLATITTVAVAVRRRRLHQRRVCGIRLRSSMMRAGQWLHGGSVKHLPAGTLCGDAVASTPVSMSRMLSNSVVRNANQETEEQRLQLDAEAREGMKAYMAKIEELAEAGNIRAQKTAWKWKVRQKVWDYLEDNDLAEFPRPVHHRIPNFKQAEVAGKNMSELPEFRSADVIKVNPDTPQKSVRQAVLEAGKTLYVPQPRLRTGFFSRILPGEVSQAKFKFASTAAGMKRLATPMDLEDRTKIDVVVVGSSAVNPETGARIGKGEGFAELEYGMMRQLGMINADTPVITSVHDSQVISEDMPPPDKPMMKHDVPVDIIVTPTKVIRVNKEKQLPKPDGIYWDLLSEQKIAQIRVLRTLKQLIEWETGEEIALAEQEEALPPIAQKGPRKGLSANQRKYRPKSRLSRPGQG